MSAQLKLIGDQTRLTILSFLKEQELCVCDLVELIGMSQPAISQHLKKLKEAEIILERKVGTWVHFRLNQNLEPYIEEVIKKIPTQHEKLYSYLELKANKC